MMAKMNVGKDVREIKKGGLCFRGVCRHSLDGLLRRESNKGSDMSPVESSILK